MNLIEMLLIAILVSQWIIGNWANVDASMIKKRIAENTSVIAELLEKLPDRQFLEWFGDDVIAKAALTKLNRNTKPKPKD